MWKAENFGAIIKLAIGNFPRHETSLNSFKTQSFSSNLINENNSNDPNFLASNARKRKPVIPEKLPSEHN